MDAPTSPTPKMSLKREWILGVGTSVVTLAALVYGKSEGKITNSSTHQKVIASCCAAVVALVGGYAVRRVSRATGRTVARQANVGAGASLRLVVTAVGSVIILIALFAVLGVSVQHLLLGAGVAGIILGIAAQQSLGNIFAAVVMLFARPFVVGDRIRIRSGVVGVLDVDVLGIGLTYVTVQTDDGILKIPNSVVLSSGIGRARAPQPAPKATNDPTNKEVG